MSKTLIEVFEQEPDLCCELTLKDFSEEIDLLTQFDKGDLGV